MKRFSVVLLFATLVGQVALAQSRELDSAWHAWNSSLARPLQDMMTQGTINSHYRRWMSRAEYGVMTWQMIQVAAALGARDPRSEGSSVWERPFAQHFWRIEILANRHRPVFLDFGYDLEDIETCLSDARRGLKTLHPDVFVSIYDRFSDVSKGHWADEAFHNLRMAGILIGYPDNTIRP